MWVDHRFVEAFKSENKVFSEVRRHQLFYKRARKDPVKINENIYANLNKDGYY